MTKTKLRKIAQEFSVTEFVDYRQWLRSIYERTKEANESYSYARLSLDLGLSSTNAHTVINGKRSLTPRTVKHIIAALNLTGVAKRYLETLVAIERAKTAAEREELYSELLKLKTKSIDSEKTKRQFEFFRNWYNAAILELLRLPDARDDLEWIANTLTPRISLPKVKQAIELMKELGYLEVQHGRLRPTERNISTGDEVKSMALVSFMHQMIDLGKHALDKVPAKEREISSLTLSIPSQMKNIMKQEIVKLRKKLLQMSETTNDELDEIIQVNFQLFGLGKISGDEK